MDFLLFCQILHIARVILLVPPDNATPIPPFPADALRFKPHGDIENFFRRKIPAFPLLRAPLFVLGLSPRRVESPLPASQYTILARTRTQCLSARVPAFAPASLAFLCPLVRFRSKRLQIAAASPRPSVSSWLLELGLPAPASPRERAFLPSRENAIAFPSLTGGTIPK